MGARYALVLDWDTLPHHATSGVDGFPLVLGTVLCLKFRNPPLGPVEDQPVTELLLITLKAPSHRAEVFDILSRISDLTKKILVFGSTLEDENALILVGGWASVEVHWEMVANPEPQGAIEWLFVLANKDHLFHAALSSYVGN
ncbi:hypothetical protein F4604DRAFT_1960380 [Suillus subluteus]|nr:hypothetical protein F4604DRAFT_1960380 [Suillus subluteus]